MRYRLFGTGAEMGGHDDIQHQVYKQDASG
jgi:hypothetical protein